MICAAEANRDLVYFTFNSQGTTKTLEEIKEIIKSKELNVGDVYNLISEYSNLAPGFNSSSYEQFGILQFLESKYSK
jgi:hypothetical protein